jgi:hypothetical protein
MLPSGTFRPAALALLALIGTVACAGPPERTAATLGARRLVAALETRRPLPVTAVVGAVRSVDIADGELADARGKRLSHELEFTLAGHRGVVLVDHGDMAQALEVLKLHVTDLFPDTDEGEANIRKLGEFLRADVIITGSYLPDEDDLFELDLQALDIHTLEVLATARSQSRGLVQRVGSGAWTGARWVTVPLPLVWDMLTHSAEKSFGKEDMGGWETLGGIFLFPVHFIFSPFLADWTSTQWWLGWETDPVPPEELATDAG